MRERGFIHYKLDSDFRCNADQMLVNIQDLFSLCQADDTKSITALLVQLITLTFTPLQIACEDVLYIDAKNLRNAVELIVVIRT